MKNKNKKKVENRTKKKGARGGRAAKSDSAPPRGAAWEPGHELARGQSQRREASICRDGVSVAFSHSLHCPVRVAHENLESGGRETWSPASGDAGTDILNSRHGLARLTSTGTNFGVPTCMCLDQRVLHVAVPCLPSARPRLLPDRFHPKHRTSLLQEMQRRWHGKALTRRIQTCPTLFLSISC